MGIIKYNEGIEKCHTYFAIDTVSRRVFRAESISINAISVVDFLDVSIDGNISYKIYIYDGEEFDNNGVIADLKEVTHVLWEILPVDYPEPKGLIKWVVMTMKEEWLD